MLIQAQTRTLTNVFKIVLLYFYMYILWHSLFSLHFLLVFIYFNMTLVILYYKGRLPWSISAMLVMNRATF